MKVKEFLGQSKRVPKIPKVEIPEIPAVTNCTGMLSASPLLSNPRGLSYGNYKKAIPFLEAREKLVKHHLSACRRRVKRGRRKIAELEKTLSKTQEHLNDDINRLAELTEIKEIDKALSKLTIKQSQGHCLPALKKIRERIKFDNWELDKIEEELEIEKL